MRYVLRRLVHSSDSWIWKAWSSVVAFFAVRRFLQSGSIAPSSLDSSFLGELDALVGLFLIGISLLSEERLFGDG